MNEQPPMKTNTRHNSSGFTLVEMAIVLAIVALLLGGLLPTISAQIEQQHRIETRKYMNEVLDALLGYALVNGHLPCPDKDDNGVAEATCTTTAQQVGTLPYVDLGVLDHDAYNTVLKYAVTKAFADSVTLFSLSTPGTLQVCNAGCASNLTTTAPAVIISRGANWATASSADEIENTDVINTKFISRDFQQGGYDDLVVWLSPNTLFNRMVTAGKLP